MPTFYVLNVGHGNCTVLHDTNGITIIDTGPGFYLRRFLLDNRFLEVGILLLSHADSDHIAGTMFLLSDDKSSEIIKISQVYLNSDSCKDSRLWDDLVYQLCDKKIPIEPSLTTNLTGKLDQGEVRVEVLAPSPYIAARGPGSTDRKGRKLDSNSISAVIRLNYHNNPFSLLPGDIDKVGLDNLLEDKKNIQAWLVVFPHHGGKPGNSDCEEFTRIFCETVKPKIIIFSIGDNKNKFPREVVINTIHECIHDVQMYTTGSSEIFLQYIKKNKKEKCLNGVGIIKLDLEEFCFYFEKNNFFKYDL